MSPSKEQAGTTPSHVASNATPATVHCGCVDYAGLEAHGRRSWQECYQCFGARNFARYIATLHSKSDFSHLHKDSLHNAGISWQYLSTVTQAGDEASLTKLASGRLMAVTRHNFAGISCNASLSAYRTGFNPDTCAFHRSFR